MCWLMVDSGGLLSSKTVACYTFSLNQSHLDLFHKKDSRLRSDGTSRVYFSTVAHGSISRI